ncbi:MAG: nucleoside triphosphate pyrophosphohydrolase [Sphingomonadales bacterium]|nr:nucleoside triphosphate pyrophosphohydrolase [Sphingomonadales bacterium]
MKKLQDIMKALRDPETGCDWDKKQTFETIAPYTIEEAYEVAEAIHTQDMSALRDELGDLLLQVVFHAQMADELGEFNFGDVVTAVCDKMVRRHPHVFGGVTYANEDEQKQAWEDIKAAERADKQTDNSILADLPHALPALMRSEKIQKRVASVGFDWPSVEPVFDKISEEIGELKDELHRGEKDQKAIEEEYGDLMFVVVNLAKHLKIDPETALRNANLKFENRFRKLEEAVDNSGNNLKSMSLDAMEDIWQDVKKTE